MFRLRSRIAGYTSVFLLAAAVNVAAAMAQTSVVAADSDDVSIRATECGVGKLEPCGVVDTHRCSRTWIVISSPHGFPIPLPTTECVKIDERNLYKDIAQSNE